MPEALHSYRKVEAVVTKHNATKGNLIKKNKAKEVGQSSLASALSESKMPQAPKLMASTS